MVLGAATGPLRGFATRRQQVQNPGTRFSTTGRRAQSWQWASRAGTVLHVLAVGTNLELEKYKDRSKEIPG